MAVKMRISVVIPTYNSVPFIDATLESVMRQTLPPDEILVLDDGSTDNTLSLLNSYKSTITVFQQKHKGVASARNTLCEKVSGDLVAFLDHDDLWHPSYLEVQRKLFGDYPNVVAFFTGHVNFCGYGNYHWNNGPQNNLLNADIELIDPLNFIERYNKTTGHFASMSYCCIPKRVLTKLGPEPFCVAVSGADDFCLFNLLPLFGSVVYAPTPLVAYRIAKDAQSHNLLKSLALSVHAFELLEMRYREVQEGKLLKAFRMAFASRRRQYAKVLMGASKTQEARRQLWSSLNDSSNPLSLAKSLAFFLLTCMPTVLQPMWPRSERM